MPKASVIIPAYNADKHILECLLSLKEQTIKDFEVIVVDDGSMDRTYDIAVKYARVIKTTRNLGVGAARNLGAKEAKGEILAFTDADVVLPPDWLANIIEDMRLHNVKCVGGGYCGSLGHSFMERFAYLELDYRRKNMPAFVNTIVSNNFACSLDVFFECGGFPVKFKCEDLRLSFLISRKYAIFWDKNNGVYHRFKSSLGDYLKQQYYFGRDTVWSYYECPGMSGQETHQGKIIYWETALMLAFMISSIFFPAAAGFFLLAILIANYGFLSFLRKSGLSGIKSCMVILARDFICAISIFTGVLLCLKDIMRRFFKK